MEVERLKTILRQVERGEIYFRQLDVIIDWLREDQTNRNLELLGSTYDKIIALFSNRANEFYGANTWERNRCVTDFQNQLERASQSRRLKVDRTAIGSPLRAVPNAA